MGPKVIDFSNGVVPTPSAVVVSPNFSIQGRKVDIQFMASPQPMFRVNVGCQSVTVTPDNVDQMLAEAEGKEAEPQPVLLIVGNDRTVNSDTPKLKEEAGNYLISTGLRAYPKANNKVVEKLVKPTNKFFEKSNGYYRNGLRSVQGNWEVTAGEKDHIVSILNTAKAFFEQNV